VKLFAPPSKAEKGSVVFQTKVAVERGDAACFADGARGRNAACRSFTPGAERSGAV
jgi:hypothetical protein